MHWEHSRSLARGTFQVLGARIPSGLIDLGFEAAAVDGEGIATVNLRVVNGTVAALTPRELPNNIPTIDLGGGQLWPALIDMHTHLDKGHIWPRAENPDGSHAAASIAVAADRRANWRLDDVRQRFDFGLRCAYAHGTQAIRTHLDSHEAAQVEISWTIFRELRERWRSRIALQAVLMVMLDAYGREGIEPVVRMVAETGGVLGGVTKIRTPLGLATDEVDYCLDRLFTLAGDHGLDIDLHVDETLDPAASSLRQVAQAALRHRFKGRISCGHCCSLSTQSEPAFRKTVELCREAGIAIVTLPMVNLYLQDRQASHTPRRRGIAPVHELAAAGLAVAAASDNCRDPFYGYGDHDLIEVYREFVRIAHLDRPYANWTQSVAATPAALMGLAAGVIRDGGPADLILFRARTMNELLSRPQMDRIVIRGGHAIDSMLPDYRELDGLFSGQP
jgi:cytosine deaminase